MEETLEARTLSLQSSESLCGGYILDFFTAAGLQVRKGGSKDLWHLPTLCYLPALYSHSACGLPSPALESEQSRTSIDESGNRHREVLSKSWASSSVNWAVVSRAASMAWRMNQRRPEGICSQSGRKENNTYNR